MSQLINVLQGTIVNMFIDSTFGKDGREFKKRIIEISTDEGGCILQFVQSWDFKDCPELRLGMTVCVQWTIKQFGNQPKKFTTIEIIGLEILADSTQEQPQRQPQQQPADIYPVGNQLPILPAIGGVQESDFDFSNNTGEKMPF